MICVYTLSLKNFKIRSHWVPYFLISNYIYFNKLQQTFQIKVANLIHSNKSRNFQTVQQLEFGIDPKFFTAFPSSSSLFGRYNTCQPFHLELRRHNYCCIQTSLGFFWLREQNKYWSLYWFFSWGCLCHFLDRGCGTDRQFLIPVRLVRGESLDF